ncbi:LysR family transcriptional regulator [Terrihabitans rhizophilus]|uniref:LysR substrate-binding domain-containing protein n=1 Tax=Terrihabitans rhizophilus TaxID=3092662 RepID=A0ABU4RUT8_9HYPH|nr:LysR substrate-binding domain-containing protein [Terrihabitans sp. PJ23]MDX6807390.1 LysR substrate-binding domain-containing protein [Terrihabitans sp. PJ23]
MDIRQLRYFMQVADSGNFSRAAEILRVAQPSLSQQIKNLELELGVELLVRHSRGVTPTEVGLRLYEHAQRIVTETERAREVVRTTALNPSGEIRVGLPTSACRNLSVPLYEALAERLPDIKLHIIEAMTGALDEWIQKGRLDVALLYDHKAFEHVAWTEMIVEELMLFLPPGMQAPAGGEMPLREIFNLPVRIIAPGRPNVARVVIDQMLARCDIQAGIYDCDSLPAIGGLVREGHFAAVMPHFAFLAEIQRGEMIPVRIVDPVPSWRLSVVVSERTMNSRGSSGVAQVMADVIGDLVARGVWKARSIAQEEPAGELALAHVNAP